MFQLENHPLPRGEFVECASYLSTELPPHQIALGISAAASICYLREHVIDFAISIRRYRSIFFPHLLLADVIQAQIRNNAVNPRIERAFEAEAPDVLVGLQERVLINVLRFVL